MECKGFDLELFSKVNTGRFFFGITMAFLGGNAVSESSAEFTHCAEKEFTYFSCQLRGSQGVISICGSASNTPLEDPGMLLDFRSGMIGVIDFKYPDQPVSAQSGRFFGDHLTPHGQGVVADVVAFAVDGVVRKVAVISGATRFTGLFKRIGKRSTEAACVNGTVVGSLLSFIPFLLPIPDDLQ